MTQIIQEEGLVRGLLTPGLSASLTRSMLYGAYRVGLYATTRDWLAKSNSNHGDRNHNDGAPHIQHRILSGMMTGGLGAMLTCPLDAIRTRMQADAGVIRDGLYTTGLRKGKPVRYTSLWTTVVSIIQQEGWGQNGLYRGAPVTVARASLLNGAQLASYDTLKRNLLLRGSEEGPLLHIFCAFCSGVIAQTVVMPVDTIKSTMMVGNTVKDVWMRMVQNGGPRWFYRGYIPACTGQGLIMVVQMPLIEEFRRLLGVAAI